MEKEYKPFYQEYKKKLYEQYSSVAKEGLDLPAVSPFLIPLSQNKVEEISHLVKLLYKMTHSKPYAESINTNQSEYLKINNLDTSLLMSYDFHLDHDNNLKLIEVNTQSSGYLVSDLVDQVHEMKKESRQSLLSLKKSFEQEWQNFSGKTASPSHTLIVDHQIKDQKMYIEFLMYKDLLHLWEWPCQLEEIENLDINSQEGLINPQNKKVEMIYNRCTDFYFENLPNLKKAFLDQKYCISPHPGEYLLLADKMRLCEWSTTDFLNKLDFNLEEKEQIQKVVPFTALIDSVPANELWEKRKKLFFKPLRGYGGKSVYRGKSISRSMFDRVIKEKGIFQETVPPPLFVDTHGKEWKYDIRAYVYRDQVQKISARVYQGQLTQFQTPLSGFASICIQ